MHVDVANNMVDGYMPQIEGKGGLWEIINVVDLAIKTSGEKVQTLNPVLHFTALPVLAVLAGYLVTEGIYNRLDDTAIASLMSTVLAVTSASIALSESGSYPGFAFALGVFAVTSLMNMASHHRDIGLPLFGHEENGEDWDD